MKAKEKELTFKEKLKKPSFSLIELISFIFTLLIYVGSWLAAPLFGMEPFNVQYFLFMFLVTVIGNMLLKLSKNFPKEMEVPKKPIGLFKSIVQSMVDMIIARSPNEVPATEFVEMLKRLIIWKVRDAELDENIDEKALEEIKQYIHDKLFNNGNGDENEHD